MYTDLHQEKDNYFIFHKIFMRFRSFALKIQCGNDSHKTFEWAIRLKCKNSIDAHKNVYIRYKDL